MIERRATLSLLLSSLFAAAALACEGTPRSASDSTAASAPADREADFRASLGRTWELARLGTREIPPPTAGTPADSPGRDLVPGRRPTLRFSPDTAIAGGRSFCNGYGGPFDLEGDSLQIREIMSTAVGCDHPDSLETRFFRALRLTRRYRLLGDSLTLLADDGPALVFVATEPASP